MSIARRNLRSLLCFLLAAVILSAFFLPVTAKATHTYRFLNPLGTVEPRLETPLADRQGVIDILNGTVPADEVVLHPWTRSLPMPLPRCSRKSGRRSIPD